MRSDSDAKGDVLSVVNVKFSTCLFHYFRDGRIVSVTDPREKVVLNLKIQSAQEPALHPAAAGKVHSGFGLMYRPGIGYRTRVSWR